MLNQYFKEYLESMGMDVCPTIYDPTTFTPMYSVWYNGRMLRLIASSDYFNNTEITIEVINDKIVSECHRVGVRLPDNLINNLTTFGIKKRLKKLIIK
jgi:hypothetical protein